jgi:hypothetical protein
MLILEETATKIIERGVIESSKRNRLMAVIAAANGGSQIVYIAFHWHFSKPRGSTMQSTNIYPIFLHPS